MRRPLAVARPRTLPAPPHEENNPMNLKKILGSGAALVALSAAAILYSVHPAKSSDHQDTYNLANAVGHNTSADITDVLIFPSPTNPNNVVLTMDVSPLIPAGMGTSKFFDPTLMWQFKIAHGASNYQEDQVIQFGVTGTDANQTITMYGPSAPNEVGTVNTFVSSAGSFGYNDPKATIQNGSVKVFAGPRADPFYFDLFQFFTFLGDRAYSTHTSQTDPGFGSAPNGMLVDSSGKPNATPSFNGFASGTTSGPNGSGYACSTKPAQNALADINGGFNVLSFVVELPKSALTQGFSSPIIHVWATASSSTTTN